MSVKQLDELLNAAIDQEISAQRFYRDALEFTDNRRVKDFLLRLAAEEKEHERILRSVLEMEIYDGTIPVEEDMVAETRESHATDNSDIRSGASLSEIFEIALRRENTAYKNYQKMADHWLILSGCLSIDQFVLENFIQICSSFVF